MKYTIDGQDFCDVKDISGINPGTLKWNLSQARKTTISRKWHNIPNPHFNGKNSRRLVLIDSIPNLEIRRQVIEKLQASTLNQQFALEMLDDQGLSAVSRTTTEITSQTLRQNARYLAKHLTEHINKEHLQYAGHFMHFDIQPKRMMIYAKTTCFALFVVEQVHAINNLYGVDQKAFNKEYRSFRINLLSVLEDHIKDLSVPGSDQRFKNWCDDLVSKASKWPEEPWQWINVQRCGNQSASKFTNEQKKLAEALYMENAMPVKHVYEALLLKAKQQKWWVSDGQFRPITYQTVCNHINSVKELLDARRVGRSAFIVNNIPTTTREYPQQSNIVWGFDGTAHDEFVLDDYGSVRQSLNVLRVFDYSTLRLLATVPFVGGERADHYSEAFKLAVINCGYRPKWVQTDQGPAFKKFKDWCEEREIAIVPANIGLARAKLVENLLGRMGNLIYRHALKGWSGQNLTARGKNSQVSREDQDKRKKSARSIVQAAYWTANQAHDEWNTTIIDQLGRKPCGKTPNELWNEKESATSIVDPAMIAILYGNHHEVQLTIEGAPIQHTDNLGYQNTYIYFPSTLETEEDLERTLSIFQRLPHTRKHAVKIHLYVSDYGKEAHVFEHPWNGSQPPKSLGTWVIKPTISMVAAIEGQKGVLNNWQLFKKKYLERAKDYIENTYQEIKENQQENALEELIQDPLKGRKRSTPAIKPSLNKQELYATEELFKLAGGDEMKMEEMRKVIDPDTGEIFYIKNRNND